MMKPKPLFCMTLLASCLLATPHVQAYELITYPSPWAETASALAKGYSLTSGIANSETDYKRDLTQAELASLISNVYAALSAENESLISNEIEGDKPVTREQLAVTLYQVMQNFMHVSLSLQVQSELDKYIDATEISETAKEAIAFFSMLGIINGNNRNEILPQSICKYEEALLMSVSFVKNMQHFGYGDHIDQAALICDLPAPQGVYTIDYKDFGFYSIGMEVTWNEVPGAFAYAVDVLTDDATHTYERYITQENTFTLPIDSSEENKIVVRAGTGDGRFSVNYAELVLAGYITPPEITQEQQQDKSVSYTSYMDFLAKNKNATLSAVAYQSNEQALKDMQEVTLKVWNIKNGEKVTAYKTILINKKVADTVVKIFDEIYNGSEKFPIYAVTGYNWRGAGSKSAHLQGLAIDINPTENYYVSSGGKVYAGSFWNPSKSEYSISKDGDVVKAFSKYGWFWGGVGWDKSKDYMHFSYNGV